MSIFRTPVAMFALALVLLGTVRVDAQVSFSIDSQGPTNGLIDPVGAGPISGGDILVPTPPIGPPPTPTIAIPVGPAGLGVVPAAFGFTEVDALAYGDDDVIFFQQQQIPSYYYFSVDEFAVGIPGAPLPPNVTTEGAVGALEAAADVFVYPPFPFAPMPPIPAPGPVIGNTGVFDGNGGLTPFASPTLNLIEPNPPATFTGMADFGDNLDALDVDSPVGFPVFYSLDSMFPDPLEVGLGGLGPPNTGTALANGFVGGDVLVTPGPGIGPVLYAPAFTLGLDILGVGSDDLDALILNDFTDGLPMVYTPTTGPYSWLFGGTDMLLFSVRRNSALIGTLDSISFAPIEEGDILVPMGPGIVPGIFIPAETLGLATVRSGTAVAWGAPNPEWGLMDVWADDLDALDVSRELIPEPGTTALMLLAVLGMFNCRTRRTTCDVA